MIGLYNYSVFFTFLGTLCGIFSIYFSTSGNCFYGVIFLMLAGFFDMFDGMVARTRKHRSEFDMKYGIQLDSLSDVVCFGVAPFFLAIMICQDYPILQLCSGIYLLTAISRLAYFNVEEELRRKTEDQPRKTYTGLPVTASALIFPVSYMLRGFFSTGFPIFYFCVLVLTSMLQISKLKIPHLQWKGLLVCLTIGILLISLLILSSNQ